jgi:sugar O-acyltransferase (sialic acid O-acetyltransferase NeuD family)
MKGRFFDQLLIMGAGGHAREIAWLASRCFGTQVQLMFVVTERAFLREPIAGVPVVLLEDCQPSPGTACIVGVGNPSARRQIADLCSARGFTFATLVDPAALHSDTVHFGAGSIVCAGAVLTVDIEAGAHVHFNRNCNVGHDTKIGAFTTISPGVNVSGNVCIGEGVFVGTGASIINGLAGNPLTVGDGAVVAAGACVTGSVEGGTMVAGVPAIRKK